MFDFGLRARSRPQYMLTQLIIMMIDVDFKFIHLYRFTIGIYYFTLCIVDYFSKLKFFSAEGKKELRQGESFELKLENDLFTAYQDLAERNEYYYLSKTHTYNFQTDIFYFNLIWQNLILLKDRRKKCEKSMCKYVYKELNKCGR